MEISGIVSHEGRYGYRQLNDSGPPSQLFHLQPASPILSEQDLRDIPHMEGLMFNTRFTYSKIFVVPRDF